MNQGSRWDQVFKRGRWSWTLKLAQKRSGAGRRSWAAKVGLLSLQVVQQQCNGHCPCDCTAWQLKQQLHGALVTARWRGDTALTVLCGGPWSLQSFSGGICCWALTLSPSPLFEDRLDNLYDCTGKTAFAFELIQFTSGFCFLVIVWAICSAKIVQWVVVSGKVMKIHRPHLSPHLC